MIVKLRRRVAKIINSVLGGFDFEIRKRSRKLERSKFLRYTDRPIPVLPVLAFLKAHIGDVFFVQIGANDGVSFDDLFDAVERLELSGLVIEPMEHAFSRLCKNYEKYPNVTPIRVAIDEHSGERPLYKVDMSAPGVPEFADGIASFDPNHHRRSGVPSDAIVTEMVMCTTLGDLLEERQVKKVDFLQIDTEGFDGKILFSIDWSRLHPSAIRFEYASLIESERDDLAVLLDSLGYELIRDNENVIAIDKVILGKND